MNTIALVQPRSLAKGFCIAIGVGALYFAMLVFNPLSALTGVASLQSLAKVRWANLLRPMALASPSVAFGIAGANYGYNVYSGRIALGAYSVMPFAILGIMLGMYYAGKLLGRSFWKDMGIVSVAGFLIGLLVSLNLSLVAFFSASDQMTMLLSAAISWKCISHVLVMQAGLLLMAGAKLVSRRRL